MKFSNKETRLENDLVRKLRINAVVRRSNENMAITFIFFSLLKMRNSGKLLFRLEQGRKLGWGGSKKDANGNMEKLVSSRYKKLLNERG